MVGDEKHGGAGQTSAFFRQGGAHCQLAAAIAVAIWLLAAPALAQPYHEYRFPGNARDSGTPGGGNGIVGANITFTDTDVPGGIGRAAVFAATQSSAADRITVPNANFVDFGTGNFTIAFWAKRTTLDGSAHGILDALNGAGVGWQISFTTANLVSCRIDGSTGSSTATLNSVTAISDSNWHHYAVTVARGSATGFVIYIDGVAEPTGSTTGVTGSINPDQDTQIGGFNNTAGLGGQLALVQIYTTPALTAAQVAALSAVGHPSHEYQFEGDGNDSAGTANGTVGANVTFTSTGVPSVLGQAAVFGSAGGNSANRIDIPTTNFPGLGTGSFSLSCWVKRDVLSGGNCGILDGDSGTDGIQATFNSSNAVHLRLDDTTSGFILADSTGTVADLNWHHVLISVDRSASPNTVINFYVDGVAAGTTSSTALTAAINFGVPPRIGTFNSNGLQGKLARLSFFGAALTATDAKNLADLDGDGVSYTTDICQGFDDLTDSDGDGVPDGCDLCTGFPNVDTDGDGICDANDNCPMVANVNQTDTDGDGLGDVCDACIGASQHDSDGDGVCDEYDACPGPDSACTVPAGVICVWATAPGAGNGTNWYNASHKLTDAIAAATPGQEIWVAAGTYYPDGGYRPLGGQRFTAGSGNRSASFTLKNGVAIYGGFNGNESLRSQRNWTSHVTTLSGEIQGDGNSSNNSYHVFQIDSSIAPTAVLDGFTISDGHTNVLGGVDSLGGGMYIAAASTELGSGAGGSPTLANCIFSANTANSGGGGIYLESGSPKLTNCTFIANTTPSVAAYGGGMEINSGSPTLINCIFDANTAALGGAIYNNGSPTITNCTFSANTAHTSGGGIEVGGGSPTITNCILWTNTGRPQIDDPSNLATVSYCIVLGGATGPTNVDTDPLFTDVDGADDILGTLDDDLRVNPGSSAINTGNSAAVPAGLTTDFAGNPRFIGCVVDRGAYERVFGNLTDSDGDGFPDSCDRCPGFNDNLDTDGDHIPDGCDLCPNGPASLRGDVNGDSAVDLGDVGIFVNILLNPAGATPAQLCAADVNFDNKLDGLDVGPFVSLLVGP